MEVYLPETSDQGKQPPDFSQLRERWVGWAVEYVQEMCGESP